MIYTITLNPSIDYIATCSNFILGKTNRTSKEIIYPGGKGINVSLVLRNLGLNSIAYGFLAGFTGMEILRLLDIEKIKHDFIFVENGMSRIDIKIQSNQETELNGMGPIVNENSLNKLHCKLNNLKEGDILVLAGSIPKSLNENIYEQIIENLKDRKVNIIVDATNNLLVNTLKYKPFLIKPNVFELGQIFQKELINEDEIIEHAIKLKRLGAINVIVSMGKDGAILIDEYNKIHKSKVPQGKLVNSIGSGDSMVAGFIYGYLKFIDYEKAFKYALCCGSASAYSINFATKDEVEKLLEKLN